MIVNYGEQGWEIVTQRAHGIVAAQVAFNWKFDDQPRNWMEILLAIAEHDDAENELDGEELLTNAGGPLNYDMKKFDLAHCIKLSSLTLVKSRMIALLTSLHMEFLYASAKTETAAAKKFLADQKRLRAKWMKELKMSETELLRIYNLLEWCDALSLLICKADFQDDERSIEISTGPDKNAYYLKKLDEGTLTIEPWPFVCTSFEILYETRTLKQISFKSSGDFREFFLRAPVKTKTWTLKKALTKTDRAKAITKVKK